MAELLQTTLCYLEQNGCYLMLHRIKRRTTSTTINGSVWAASLTRRNCRSLCPARSVGGNRLDDAIPAYRGIVDFTCEPWPAERMHLYTCTDFTGTLTDCNEGTLEWVPKPEVENLPIWQGTKFSFGCWRRAHRFSIWS